MVHFNDLEWRIDKEEYPLAIYFESEFGHNVARFVFGVPYSPDASVVTFAPKMLVVHSVSFCTDLFTEEDQKELTAMVNHRRYRGLANASLMFGCYVDSENVGPISELAHRYGDLY